MYFIIRLVIYFIVLLIFPIGLFFELLDKRVLILLIVICIVYELFIIGIGISDITRTFKKWKRRNGQDVKLLIDNMEQEEVV